MTYAEKTDVSVERSKGEIERTLARYGATKFFTGWDADAAVVGFSMADRFVQFRLPQPRRDDYRITPTGVRRTSQAAIDAAYEQAQRSRWRALLLVIKAKLESVESGIESFEEAFLSHIMIADGSGGSTTIGDVMIPQIKESYAGGRPHARAPGGPVGGGARAGAGRAGREEARDLAGPHVRPREDGRDGEEAAVRKLDSDAARFFIGYVGGGLLGITIALLLALALGWWTP